MDTLPGSTTHYVPFLTGKDSRGRHTLALVRKALIPALAALTAVSCLAFFFYPSAPPAQESLINTELYERPSRHFFTERQFSDAFVTFVTEHGKVYANEKERQIRFDIFKKNLAFIHAHNQQGFRYTLAANQFADMTHEEFKAQFVGYRRTNVTKTDATHLLGVHPSTLPKDVDWRAKGCVTEVKNQAQCGSCWAFSTTGAIEGATCAKTGRLPDLSEQQLVDCAGIEGNQGCSGGEMDQAFQYVIDNKGLCSEMEYPYEATDDKCKADSCKPQATIKGFKNVPMDNEAALMAAVATNGPVSVAIEADQLPFQFYQSGVFDASCGDQLDHGVLVVGYGTDEQGQDYWIVKNSWGPSWGDDGYIRMARHRGKEGECGILMDASYPVV
ncbi:unnamed protein product [Vitrella brassicaformis CCMP3155]|uniref:Uncharacterized protein n=2 Tax=Vitrella brassicaformis TaxID=1169539 RepID=A0A0G4EYB1_VITBC|nr:unnamed protein product [Vitrella brassicaformis CCMP3155]|mmetsp:Transcript_38999/g.97600  ORF Transcript_38999/g.97600 Transcript_38999/m.97600 type:complete len:386 (+) Transcript_38999:120-1277(+)|eukprot:CEM03624.1 unnamed protein product [Vitrella brassicaformis CCMP3155]